MSPLIYFMKPIKPNIELSYGVVTVYSCSENCVDKRNDHRFSEEFYIKQDD